jgi:hypothetical protein
MGSLLLLWGFVGWLLLPGRILDADWKVWLVYVLCLVVSIGLEVRVESGVGPEDSAGGLEALTRRLRRLRRRVNADVWTLSSRIAAVEAGLQKQRTPGDPLPPDTGPYVRFPSA